ncbi:hypothetical protein ACHQM5_025924 [Ranunculus cassubicifolius]
MIIRIYRIYSLSNRKHHKKHCCHKRKYRPRTPEICMNKICPPLIAFLPTIIMHLLMHPIQTTLGIQSHIFGQCIK